MKAKGLLDKAGGYNKEPHERKLENDIDTPSPLADKQGILENEAVVTDEKDLQKNFDAAHEIPDNVIIVAAQNTPEEKLLSHSRWKSEITDSAKSLKKLELKYDHELVAYSNWRNQVDSVYERIKKSTEGVLPDMHATEADEAEIEEVLPEHVYEESSMNEDIPTEVSVYDFDGLASIDIEELQESKVGLTTSNASSLDDAEGIDTQARIKIKKKIALRKKRREFLGDAVSVIVCLLGSLVCVYYFFLSFNQSLEKANEVPIATITYKYKSAQRKLSDRILWDRVQQNTPIYDGDIIRTADLSEATITFKDGNIINLYEQSLAQVFFDEEGASIDFNGGEISVDSAADGGAIILNNGDTTVKLETGSTLIASAETQFVDGVLTANENSSLTVQVTNGEASFLAPDSLTDQTLEVGVALVVAPEGDAVKEPTVTVFTPTTNAKYLRKNSETMEVVFNWASPPNTTESYTFELSKQKDFLILEDKRDVSGVSSFSANLEDGMWYWRIYSELPINGRKGKFRIIESNVASTIIPAPNEEYTYTVKAPSIRFMWSEDVYATDWLFEIADNAQMENPLFAQNIPQASSTVSTLEEGTWYWRVTPSYGEGIIYENTPEIASSNISSFVIKQNENILPVGLSFPQKNHFVNIEESQNFSWEYDNEADFYTLNLSKNNNMNTIDFTQTVQRNYYVVSSDSNTLEPGLWYWSVTKTDTEGNVSPISEIRSFVALEGDPILEAIEPQNKEIILEQNISTINFTWDTNLSYEARIQIAQDESFENLYVDTISNTNSLSSITLPVGKWYWRIVAFDINANFSYVSEAKEFYVETDLEAVEVQYPSHNESIVMFAQNDVVFEWNSVENAEYYELRLFDASDMQTTTYENLDLRTTRHAINMNAMDPGSYVYELRAVTENTPSMTVRKSAITQGSFSTRFLDPIHLAGPSTIDGITALVSPPSIRWNTTENVVSSELILSSSERGLSVETRGRGERPLSSQIRLSINNPSATISLPPLKEGVWYWTVIGETEEGYDISAISPSRIVVNPIENLRGTTALNPMQGEIFDVGYLAISDYIDFSWNPVLGAEAYIFILRNSNNDIILEKEIKDSTRFRFEDLSALDRGSFTWSIEAMRSLPEDTVQRGNLASFSFVIDLGQITSPLDRTEGDLYGL